MLPLLLLATLMTSQATDALTPTRAGKFQCVQPDTEKKTCVGTTRYTVAADGGFESTSVVMLAPTPLLTMEVTSKGKVSGDQLCGTVRKSDYDAAVIKMEGTPADEATAKAIRSQLGGAIATLDGKMGCTTDKRDGDVIVMEATVDGTPRPELNQRVIWVSPSDGYRLGK